MSAEIIELATVRAGRRDKKPALLPSAAQATPVMGDQGPRFHFWTGASGKRYVHTVYSLFDCPPVGIANYVLVRREAKGHRRLLAIGRVSHETATLNLAEIRQRGASLGADEVHVHLLAASPQEAQAVEVDLKSAQFAALSG